MNSIQRLDNKVRNHHGHKFLYDDFQYLVYDLEKNSNLSKEEFMTLDELVATLLYESERYSSGFPYYPLWSVRCLDCASILMKFIPENFPSMNWNKQKKEEIINKFLSQPILLEFSRTQLFKAIVDDEVETLWKMASRFFYLSDEGRRPKSEKEESVLYDMMLKGYRFADKYINMTQDASHFPEWFSHLSPFRINNIAEIVYNCTQCELEWRNKKNDKVLQYLEETLDMQLSLLKIWLDYDVEGFVNYWGERVKDLLELVEDDVFYYFLNKMSMLGGNKYVNDVLKYYANDEEPEIRDFAIKQLRNVERTCGNN